MTKDEFALFASALKTYYPREDLFPNKQALELWFRQLEDIPYNVACNVLNSWVSLNRYSPSIADIRENSVNLVYGRVPEWGEAWGEVVEALGRFGIAGEYRAISYFSPLTLEAVNKLGYRNLCRSNNPSADRANFRDIYESLYAKVKKERQIPCKVLEEAKGLRYVELQPSEIDEKTMQEAEEVSKSIDEIISENIRKMLEG